MLTCLGLEAQITLSLSSKNYNFGENGYYYGEVIDTRPSKYFLGKLYNRNGVTDDLEIRGGTEKAFLNQTESNFIRRSNSTALIAEITDLNFKETRRRDGLISGKATIRLSIYTVHEGDTSLICKPYSSSLYERSLNNLKEESFEPILNQMWFSCLEFVDNYVKLNKSRIEAFNEGVEIIILPYEARNTRDTVHYNSRKVTWDDFKAEPRRQSRYAAAIFPTIALGSKLTVRNGRLTAILSPQVFMIQSQSWAKSVARNKESLEHEQIHFDITKVVMDRLIVKLREINANTMDDLSSYIQYEYLQAFREMNKLQDAYDSESNHNLNKVKQAEWAKKVKDWLAEGNF
ncbi:hypothetical protein [Arcticibacterium luteifluviistationis]|uniref:DUF922 domain-containing protein n=1 Tax=Arcticibacterium luteifluviistationis TaxID=1784714 RepID=A0A2Z4GAR3_9BACT|nr:hypothetical protein [Arcticibacterium luteifluviistationis]AWV98234.1 hypothetical protein DJ013_08645 [Arcticibacterium luteifluviistationis]